MSHQSTISAVIQGDEAGLTALAQAARELGCILQNGASRGRIYGGVTQAADFIIRVPQARYDVLVTKNPDSTLSLSTDFYGGSVGAVLGTNLESLVQGYQVARTIAEYQSRGYTVTREVDAVTQEVLLTVGGFA